MTLANALTFIKRGQKESSLRATLNRASTALEFSSVMVAENLKFTSHEFEEAFSMKLVNCQEHEEIEDLKAFKMWWNVLCINHVRIKL